MSEVNIPISDISRRIINAVKPNGPNADAVTDLKKAWATRYYANARRFYRENAAGGGDWAPLKPSTIASRRSGSGKATIGGLRKKGLQQARRARTDRQGRAAVKKLKKAAVASASVKILIDTGTLFNTLSLGKPGAMFEQLEDGVQMGIDSSAKHPDGKATLGEIAVWHSTGAGNLPKRRMLPNGAELSEDTKRGMIRDLERAMQKIAPKIDQQ